MFSIQYYIILDCFKTTLLCADNSSRCLEWKSQAIFVPENWMLGHTNNLTFILFICTLTGQFFLSSSFCSSVVNPWHFARYFTLIASIQISSNFMLIYDSTKVKTDGQRWSNLFSVFVQEEVVLNIKCWSTSKTWLFAVVFLRKRVCNKRWFQWQSDVKNVNESYYEAICLFLVIFQFWLQQGQILSFVKPTYKTSCHLLIFLFRSNFIQSY